MYSESTISLSIPVVRGVAVRNQSEVGVEIEVHVGRVKQHTSMAEVISSAPGRIL
jgi:hypothetical protein